MGDKRSGMDRRQVLKLVMIGGVATAVVMPSKWVKPVVNAVIPPAHAAASAPSTTTTTTTPAPEEKATVTTAAPTPQQICDSTNSTGYPVVNATTIQGSAGSASTLCEAGTDAWIVE